MAEAAAMHAALARIGFTNEAAAAIINEQGIDSMTEIYQLKDDAIEQLCKVVHCPGRAIVNPQAGTPGQQATLPNPGTPVSLRAESNLKLAAYWACFRKNTHRTTTPADLDLEPIRALQDLHDWEDAHEEAKPPDKLVNTHDWHKTLEAIEEYHRGCPGVMGIPLSYVVREAELVMPDPEPGAPMCSLQDELIACVPIATALPPNVPNGLCQCLVKAGQHYA